jgi:hypothetical protein
MTLHKEYTDLKIQHISAQVKDKGEVEQAIAIACVIAKDHGISVILNEPEFRRTIVVLPDEEVPQIIEQWQHARDMGISVASRYNPDPAQYERWKERNAQVAI